MIVLFGDVCGAHFNPAVTLGVFIKEFQQGKGKNGKNIILVVLIIVAQLIGATIGVAIVYLTMTNLGTKDHKMLVDTMAVLCPPIEKEDPDYNHKC